MQAIASDALIGHARPRRVPSGKSLQGMKDAMSLGVLAMASHAATGDMSDRKAGLCRPPEDMKTLAGALSSRAHVLGLSLRDLSS